MGVEDFQNLVIGSGEAGKWIAWTLAGMGQSTVMVERSLIGGACPNVACLPSKNVIHGAKVTSLVRRAAEFGIRTGTVSVDMAGVYDRKQRMVESEQQFHLAKFKETGTEVVFGEARFSGPKTVEVALSAGGSRTLCGERVFLAVGSRASVPDVPGMSDARPMTHVDALDLRRLPEHLVVLGGGYVGLEFAQAMRRFGSRVTIVHRGKQLLDREDADVAEALLELMRDDAIEVVLGAEVAGVTGRSGERVTLRVRSGDGAEREIGASDILVATGRTPNTDRLNATAAGIALDARGYIRVDDQLRATAPDVWAMGDCAGSPHFTHVSFDDFRIVRDNLAGGQRTKRGRLIPSCLFTDPELVHIGLHEHEARSAGTPYRLAKAPMAAVLRTHTHSEQRGFMKVLVGNDNRLLGFTALGAEASELLGVAQTAMLGGMTVDALRMAIFAHPTTAEGITVLLSRLNP